MPWSQNPLAFLFIAWSLSPGQVLAACLPSDPSAALPAARDAAADGHAAEALSTLSTTWESLPESCDPVTPDVLGRLALLAGAIALDAGDAPAADEWFDRAGALLQRPTIPASYGPTSANRYAARTATVEGLGTATVVAEEALWLDGVALPAGTTQTIWVGSHLLQVDGGSGRWIQVGTGQRLGLPSAHPVEGEASSEKMSKKPFLLVGSGGLVAAGGALLVRSVYRGEAWYDGCRTGFHDMPGDAEQDALPSSYASLQTCGELTGEPLAAKVVLGYGLVGLGAATAALGIGLFTYENLTAGLVVQPDGLYLAGRF